MQAANFAWLVYDFEPLRCHKLTIVHFADVSPHHRIIMPVHLPTSLTSYPPPLYHSYRSSTVQTLNESTLAGKEPSDQPLYSTPLIHS